MNFMALNPNTIEEVLAKLEGLDLDTYRKMNVVRTKESEEALKYLNLPPEQWPELKFNWDLSFESQRFSLDGVKQSEFEKNYPQGLCLGWVSFPEFDEKLCKYSRRDGPKELWELGCPSKLAHMIVYLSKGRPISPLLVKPLETKELILQGGHHRYAAAKATNISLIPIYVEPANIKAVESIIPVNWLIPNNSFKADAFGFNSNVEAVEKNPPLKRQREIV